MEIINVKIRRIRNEVPLPAYATEGSAGMDLRACMDEEKIILPGQSLRVPTGLAFEIPDPEVVALICARSGLAAKFGVSLTNGIGVIDSDYRGEVQVLLINQGSEPFTVRDGDRIAQMLFVPVLKANLELVEELSETERGEGGFGSTGI